MPDRRGYVGLSPCIPSTMPAMDPTRVSCMPCDGNSTNGSWDNEKHICHQSRTLLSRMQPEYICYRVHGLFVVSAVLEGN